LSEGGIGFAAQDGGSHVAITAGVYSGDGGNHDDPQQQADVANSTSDAAKPRRTEPVTQAAKGSRHAQHLRGNWCDRQKDMRIAATIAE
jgi:hypothetical protein